VPLLTSQRKDGRGQRHEAPHQIERFFGISLSEMIDDRVLLCLEIIDEAAPVLPVDEAPGAGDSVQPLADFARNFGRTLRAGEFKPQTALDRRIRVADLDQEIGPSRSAPSASRFFVVRVFFGGIVPILYPGDSRRSLGARKDGSNSP